MALTQIQIIQSLGEAMNWLEREISWGVSISEQRHLVGRIGELYAALMSNGQMAPEVNQSGYDVVSSSGERISVKTTTQAGPSGHIAFNANTIDQVDRIIVLYLNTEEMQIDTLLDGSLDEAKTLLSPVNRQGKLVLPLSKLKKASEKNIDDQKTVAEAFYPPYTIREFESGTVIVLRGSEVEQITKPVLREISSELGLPLINSNGNPMNTRQLGSRIIKHLQAKG